MPLPTSAVVCSTVSREIVTSNDRVRMRAADTSRNGTASTCTSGRAVSVIGSVRASSSAPL